MAFAPKVPLYISDIYGAYGLIDNYRDLIKQNLMMVVLTAPGERIMDPLFGVGLRNFLFENTSLHIASDIRGRIRSQVGTYLPFVELGEIDVNFAEGEQILNVRIHYRVGSIGLEDSLAVSEIR